MIVCDLPLTILTAACLLPLTKSGKLLSDVVCSSSPFLFLLIENRCLRRDGAKFDPLPNVSNSFSSLSGSSKETAARQTLPKFPSPSTLSSKKKSISIPYSRPQA